jgi:formylglycine-generating enzyme required for sulfatase activity
VALLIGNQSYTSEIGRLGNPHNDIALLEQALKGLRFDVTTVRDAGLAALHRAVNAYARRVRAAGPDVVGFFYYAGHGAADEAGTNYLIPVDARSAEEVELWDQSLRLREITRKLKVEAGNAKHFVVFDACRNTLKLRKAGSRAIVESRGFVPVREESGMLIAYATAEGALASDVGADSGPYARVLAEEIVKPGIEAVTMFRTVQLRVREAIGQEPWIGFSALGGVHLGDLAPDQAKSPPVTQAPAAPFSLSEAERQQLESAEAVRICREVEGMSNLSLLGVLAGRHKGTLAGDCIAARIEELRRAEAAKTKAEERLALLQRQEEERKRGEAEAKRKAEEEQARRDPALSVRPGSGESFRDCPECPEMVVVPAGSFMMGSSESEAGRDSGEGPQRRVTIARPFAVGKFEVTRGQFAAFVRETGRSVSDKCWTYEGGESQERSGRSFRNPGFEQDDRHPAVCVSWDDASAFVGWLSRKTGKPYRLLSEAEWEYAARAGTTTRYAFGDTISKSQAQFSAKQTVEVGTFASNAWGLHDMHGNVVEWVEEAWHPKYHGAPVDGSVWPGGDLSLRVLRGGSWGSNPVFLRSAVRDRDRPTFRCDIIGFRVSRTL